MPDRQNMGSNTCFAGLAVLEPSGKRQKTLAKTNTGKKNPHREEKKAEKIPRAADFSFLENFVVTNYRLSIVACTTIIAQK